MNNNVTRINQQDDLAESFIELRKKIEKISNIRKYEKLKSIMVTSIGYVANKSWLTTNLAISFAKKGEKVILVDANMKNASQHKILKTFFKNGLSDILSLNQDEDMCLIEYIKDTKMKELKFISAGSAPFDTSELLLSENFEKFLNKTEDAADLIIFDTPAVNSLDTTILASKIDGILLVVQKDSIEVENLKIIIKNLRKINSNILGIVFNKIPDNANKQYSFKKG